MTTIRNGDLICDGNGNRASINYFGSRRAAEAALASLRDCRDCENCADCSANAASHGEGGHMTLNEWRDMLDEIAEVGSISKETAIGLRGVMDDAIQLEIAASTLLLSTSPNSLATKGEIELDRRRLSNALRRIRGERPLFCEDGGPRPPEPIGGTHPDPALPQEPQP